MLKWRLRQLPKLKVLSVLHSKAFCGLPHGTDSFLHHFMWHLKQVRCRLSVWLWHCSDKIKTTRRTSTTHHWSPTTNASQKSKSQPVLLGLRGESKVYKQASCKSKECFPEHLYYIYTLLNLLFQLPYRCALTFPKPLGFETWSCKSPFENYTWILHTTFHQYHISIYIIAFSHLYSLCQKLFIFISSGELAFSLADTELLSCFQTQVRLHFRTRDETATDLTLLNSIHVILKLVGTKIIFLTA